MFTTASIQNSTNLRNLSDTSYVNSTPLLSLQYKFRGSEYETKIFAIRKSLQILKYKYIKKYWNILNKEIFANILYTLIINAKGMHSCNLSAGREGGALFFYIDIFLFLHFSFILILFFSFPSSYL